MSKNRRNHLIMLPLFTLLLIIFQNTHLNGQQYTLPWDAEVRIADENIHYPQHHGPRSRSVYSGPQGAGYLLVRFFQVVISPQDGPHCRYEPVCSAYGKHALEKHGLFLGLMLAGDRIIRCNPYNPPGKDPCPDTLYDIK